MPVTMKAQSQNLASSIKIDPRAEVDQSIRQRLADCPYEFYFSKVAWHLEDGRLTLEGCVPTFYLKQMLQTILRDVKHVRQLVNDVDVVSSTGLSSVRPQAESRNRSK